MAEYNPLCVYMYHISCIHSSKGGHIKSLHVLVIVSKTAMNVGVLKYF